MTAHTVMNFDQRRKRTTPLEKLAEMGLGAVAIYISDHSVSDKKAARLRRLCEWAIRGEEFDLDTTRTVHLRHEGRPMYIESLDFPGYWET